MLANDTDPGDDPLTVTQVDGQPIGTGETVELGSGARVTLEADGTLTYDKLFLLAGVDDPCEDVVAAFAYISGGGETDSATVTVTLEGLDVPVDLTGTSAADILEGTEGADLMGGRGGNDAMFGNAGWDAMFGQGGADLMFGGSGNDAMFGGGGNDTLLGSADDDALAGNGGTDQLFGGAGNHALVASRAGSLLSGGIGNDLLTGSFGDDTFVFDTGIDGIALFDPSEDVIDLTAFGLAGSQDVFDAASDGSFGVTFDFGDAELTVLGAQLSDLAEDNFVI